MVRALVQLLSQSAARDEEQSSGCDGKPFLASLITPRVITGGDNQGERRVNLRQLEAFSAVMKSGSITQAAQAMHLSQPAVSKLIADLEHQIGFKLFARSKGSHLTPTPEAGYFFHEVERSFIGVNALKRLARDISNLGTGQVQIASANIARSIPAFRSSSTPTARRPSGPGSRTSNSTSGWRRERMRLLASPRQAFCARPEPASCRRATDWQRRLSSNPPTLPANRSSR